VCVCGAAVVQDLQQHLQKILDDNCHILCVCVCVCVCVFVERPSSRICSSTCRRFWMTIVTFSVCVSMCVCACVCVCVCFEGV